MTSSNDQKKPKIKVFENDDDFVLEDTHDSVAEALRKGLTLERIYTLLGFKPENESDFIEKFTQSVHNAFLQPEWVEQELKFQIEWGILPPEGFEPEELTSAQLQDIEASRAKYANF